MMAITPVNKKPVKEKKPAQVVVQNVVIEEVPTKAKPQVASDFSRPPVLYGPNRNPEK